MNLVVKSGSNTFKGLGSANYQTGDLQSNNITHELLGEGLRARRQQVHEAEGLLRRNRRADPARQAVVLREPSRRLVRQLHSRASSGCRIASRSSSTPSCRIRPAKITYQMTKNNKFEGDVPGRPQVAAVSHGQPLRPARIDAEPGLDVADRSVVQVAVDPVAARRRSTPACSVAATGGRTFRGRRTCARPTSRPTTADARRVPRDRSQAAALAVRRHVRVLRRDVGPQSRAQDRVSRLAQHRRHREHRLSRTSSSTAIAA